MHPVPNIMPISDLRFNQTEVIDALEKGPIVLTRQGKAVAVLVHPDQWNQLLRLNNEKGDEGEGGAA